RFRNARDNHIRSECNQFSGEFWQELVATLRRASFKPEVLTFDPAKLPKCINENRPVSQEYRLRKRRKSQITYSDLSCLGCRREREDSRCASSQFDKLASPHCKPRLGMKTGSGEKYRPIKSNGKVGKPGPERPDPIRGVESLASDDPFMST